MKQLLILLLLFSLPLFAQEEEEEYKRMDPHGPKDAKVDTMKLSNHSECMVCHFTLDGKLKTIAGVHKQCRNCHNKLPHSGLNEHMGKPLSKINPKFKGSVGCLSCHRPHRGTLHNVEYQNELTSRHKIPFIFKKRDLGLGEDFKEERNVGAMLHKDCTDCHSAENLR